MFTIFVLVFGTTAVVKLVIGDGTDVMETVVAAIVGLQKGT